MGILVNEFGNISDPQHSEFEKAIGLQVKEYLQSLLDRGCSIAEIRLAIHYLMSYLHYVESIVTIGEQRKYVRKTRGAQAVAALNEDLEAKVDRLHKDLSEPQDWDMRADGRESDAYDPSSE